MPDTHGPKRQASDNDSDDTTHSTIDSPPLSAYVDYTPRRALTSHLNHPPKSDGFGMSRLSRAYYFQQLARLEENNTQSLSNYMDSPQVRRFHGLDVNVADIDPNTDETENLPEDLNKQEWSAKDFDVGRHLGTGRFGTVYIARVKANQHVVALKILEKHELEKAKVVSFLKREIEIQGHLRHPNILRLHGYFHDGNHVYIVLEHAPRGELYSLLKKRGRFSERVVAQYMIQLISALQYIHNLRVIHRDIKPENVLIAADGKLKLADFGWAVHDPKTRMRRRTFCGTLDYLSPEMIENKAHDEKVDVWALGVMCYELLVGYPPFEDLDGYAETYTRIRQCYYKFPDGISASARHFITRILQHDPRRRPRLCDIETHPWLTKYTATR